jgi:diacylglycerol kinase (ATP)
MITMNALPPLKRKMAQSQNSIRDRQQHPAVRLGRTARRVRWRRMTGQSKQARQLAQLAARLASRSSAYDRHAEQRATSLALRAWPRRRALLIVNSKSGPNRDSLLHVRELVEVLAEFNIHADVRVKLHKKQARREARDAARHGCELVIAAGGDGTVEAVASGLVGTRAALGIIPLGTYNNLATCLGMPTDVRAAVALIATATPRAIDAGQVEVRGKKPRLFFETCAIGLGAAMTAAGQAVEKGRWQTVARTVPLALSMAPVTTQIRLDGRPPQWARTLLITVSNAPRAGAGLKLSPQARMDDGLLDVTVFDDLDQADLAMRLPSLATGALSEGDDPRVRRARCVAVRVRSARPLPVAADSKVIGTTPARLVVRPGAVLALVGPGPGLARPPSSTLQELVEELAPRTASVPVDGASGQAPHVSVPPAIDVSVLPALATGARLAAAPLATALALKLLPPVARALGRRLFGR